MIKSEPNWWLQQEIGEDWKDQEESKRGERKGPGQLWEEAVQ